MNQRFVALLTICIMFVTAACGDEDPTVATDTSTTTSAEAAVSRVITQDDDATTQSVNVGQEFAIQLETAGGAGYSWKVVTEPDSAVVKFISQSQKKKDAAGADADAYAYAESPIVGAPEIVTTTFEAVGTGKTTIVLGHVPPSGGEAEATFTVTIETR